MDEPLVIIGAGQAGAQAAVSLRQGGYDGDLIVIGEEPTPPYQRPPLSKKYLAGAMTGDQLTLRAAEFWAANCIELRLATRVSAVQPQAKTLELSDGGTVRYNKLLIATGARPQRLPVAGADLSGVHVLRTIADVDRLKPDLQAGGHPVIIGGGYIGLEFAAVCRQLGFDATVVEAQERVMQRVVSPVVSQFYQALHIEHGVELRLGVAVSELVGENSVQAVRLASGEKLPAGLVLMAVGGRPETELASACGLSCEDGIVVDARCRTSAPDIYAAGDCTRFTSRLYGRSIRLESVQNAIDQAKAAAAAMLGQAVEYDPVPWFWSDQYDVKLQIAGLSDGFDQLALDGNPQDGSFAVSYIKQGILLAVDAINNARAHMLARRNVGKPFLPAS